LQRVEHRLKVSPAENTAEIAKLYSSHIARINRRRAAQIYLEPLGLDEESFLKKQHELSAGMISDLMIQMQNYPRLESEAIIAGVDGTQANIYLVDSKGHVSCHNDVGFVAIGIGAWHAKSQLTLSKYTKHLSYVDSLATVFMAKKRAEVSPGVGIETDMILISKSGREPIIPAAMVHLNESYKEYDVAASKLRSSIINNLGNFLIGMGNAMAPPPQISAPIEPDISESDS
jgi:hypothetical protein